MRLFFTALLFLSTSAFATTENAVTGDSGQVRLPMPGRTVTSAYFTLHNNSAQDQILVGATTPAFARAELHQHSHKDGMMRMEQVEQIIIAAGKSVDLAPGGLHLMLFEPASSLSIGQSIDVVLQFADGQQLTLSLPVVAMPKR